MRRGLRRSPAFPPPRLVQNWADELAARNRSSRTIAAYLVDLRQFVQWLRDRQLEEARPEDIRRFTHAMQRAGLHAHSRARRLVALRQFYSHLVETGVLEKNPLDRVELPRQSRAKVPGFLRPEEVGRLRAAFPETQRGRRDRALVELGLSSLRVSEVVAIQFDDLFLDRGQVRIIGKGGGQYLQPVTDAAVHALEAWLAVRPTCQSEFAFIPLPPRGSRGLHYVSAERLFRGYVRAAGIARPLSFHSLRHTVGVTLADRGVPLEYIQDLLRHADPRTTRIYTSVARERLREVLQRELRFPDSG
ncbi:MAG: tyrosine-type recombinase/integrase [Armatimonadetes bacterium]|nr:tyrosine-type recombinase/integrase [Armatimonadota bacterium]